MSLTVVYILVAILLFGLLVLVHEFGHFLTAKLSGVQVNEFSLFMGPAIWKKQKGETLYSLRCIPIGGYCAMEGEDGDSDNPRAFGRAKVWKRLLILVAGSFMNLVAGLLIMTIYVASVYQAIPTRAVASVDSASVFAGQLQAGDSFYSIGGERVYTSGDVTMLLDRCEGGTADIVVLRGGEKVIAIVAPAFVGQLGPSMTPDKLKAAMKMLGFRHVAEVAVGADLCTLDEAKDFLEKVPAEQPFMATSCCPSWAVMAKKLFPEQANCISMALTPMVLTARLCKQQHPGEKVAFIGPCSAKKLEAMRTTVRSEVDFVLTFEEVMGMFEAKGINFNEITQTAPLREGTAAGRGFAVSGGVPEAVREAISHIDPDREVKTACAQGLKDCRKMLTLAKAGKYNGYLLEGMACPGGCVAGAGTLLPIEKAAAIVRNYTAQAEEKSATETKYEATLPLLLEDEEDAV